MPIFKCGFAIVLSALCLAGQTAYAQTSPVRYWIPGGPFGFGGSNQGLGSDAYGDFPSFDAGAGSSYRRYNFSNGLFVGGERGGIGWSGLSQVGAFGNLGGLSYEGAQVGYNFKGVGGLPVTFYAGFDTLKYNAGALGPLTPFTGTSATAAGYSARAGLEFKPSPNVSLSFGMGYTRPQLGPVDSDINSSLLPGETPVFIGGRR